MLVVTVLLARLLLGLLSYWGFGWFVFGAGISDRQLWKRRIQMVGFWSCHFTQSVFICIQRILSALFLTSLLLQLVEERWNTLAEKNFLHNVHSRLSFSPEKRENFSSCNIFCEPRVDFYLGHHGAQLLASGARRPFGSCGPAQRSVKRFSCGQKLC